MPVAGVIAEFDPLHQGHAFLISQVRRRLGEGTHLVAVLSGSFTQRGEAVICTPHSRAEMALRAGADLVLELPLTFATASAERFARGGVQVLQATGVVDTLCFGSESADPERLRRFSAVLNGDAFGEVLREFAAQGVPFAQARQRAVERLLGESMPEGANDLLGMEYLRFWQGDVLTVLRRDGGHNGAQSASRVRQMLYAGDWEGACALLPEASQKILLREREAGRCPASLAWVDRAMLYRMRTLTRETLARIPDCTEGLENRLLSAAARAGTMEELYALAKSKRYAHARLRRIALRAFLGIERLPAAVGYLRVLGANSAGLELLRRMKRTASLPVITKPAHGKALTGDAGAQFMLDRRADDLWGLCLERPLPSGLTWQTNPVILNEL